MTRFKQRIVTQLLLVIGAAVVFTMAIKDLNYTAKIAPDHIVTETCYGGVIYIQVNSPNRGTFGSVKYSMDGTVAKCIDTELNK